MTALKKPQSRYLSAPLNRFMLILLIFIDVVLFGITFQSYGTFGGYLFLILMGCIVIFCKSVLTILYIQKGYEYLFYALCCFIPIYVFILGPRWAFLMGSTLDGFVSFHVLCEVTSQTTCSVPSHECLSDCYLPWNVFPFSIRYFDLLHEFMVGIGPLLSILVLRSIYHLRKY